MLVIDLVKPGGPKRRLTKHRGEYQTHISHLVPSTGPIVSVMTSHGRAKSTLEKQTRQLSLVLQQCMDIVECGY